MTTLTTHRLRPAPPFDFAQTLGFLRGFTPTSGEQALGEQTLSKAVRLQGRTVAFHVRSVGTVDAPDLACELSADQPLTSHQERLALERVRFFLSLDEDLRSFYRLARQDEAFQPLLRRLYGYHQVKFLTPFENACWAVLTQRTPAPVARAAKRRLVEAYGGSVTTAHGRLWAFPEPADLADVGAPDLGALVGNARKGEALAAVTNAFLQVDKGWLRSAPSAEVHAWLLGIRGLGPWSAAFVLLRGLGRMDSVLLDDPQTVLARELLAAATRVYGPVSVQVLQARAEAYGVWQGYWAHYLRAAG
ncbi:hypothetical protein [Deinococcus sonorensis]|uniref:DNA-3-methyladenine glycosylase II n=2 Tax=Deinococcus sonorensis TaxID=309891 RepID=A0AAU7UCN9_9DEIO